MMLQQKSAFASFNKRSHNVGLKTLSTLLPELNGSTANNFNVVVRVYTKIPKTYNKKSIESAKLSYMTSVINIRSSTCALTHVAAEQQFLRHR